MHANEPLIKVNGAKKSFGAVHALVGVDFHVLPGECVGLVGHNGAGKSTLMNLLSGLLTADSGDVIVAGENVSSHHDPRISARLGVRCVYQELSLCPNLSVAENVRVVHPSIKGVGWRRHASSLILKYLDMIFPDHGIHAGTEVGDLSIARRQMVEIARAFSVLEMPIKLVVLDEPTSALDQFAAEQLVAFVRRFVESGGSVVLISHLLGEILQAADRIVVMRDGNVVAADKAENFDRTRLVTEMGSVLVETKKSGQGASDQTAGGDTVVQLPNSGGIELVLRTGEIIGFAGLSGQGQTEMLVKIFDAAHGKRSEISVDQPAVFVAGDRQSDGVFPLWSIGLNISISSLAAMMKRGMIDTAQEVKQADEWQKRLSIKTPDMNNNILSLSGGNQQKALFARALGAEAKIVLMDDPMRGVDIGTKQEVYSILADEAANGRALVWYTTETDELMHCDRVYVFRQGEIAAEYSGMDITEANILSASFEPGQAN